MPYQGAAGQSTVPAGQRTVPADPAALAAIAASDRPFQPDECLALARRAAGLLDTAALSRTGTGTSVALWEDEHSIAWLNIMPERRDTGYHDHDGSAVGVCVLAGSVTNEGLPISGPRRVHRYGPGDSFCFPGAGIHRMDHDAGAITVHVYSPPLRAIGYYEVVDGLLQRTPGPPTNPRQKARGCWNRYGPDADHRASTGLDSRQLKMIPVSRLAACVS